MGPLFSTLVLATAAFSLLILIFAIARVYWHWRTAAVMASIIVVSLGVGFGIGVVVQIPFLPETLTSTSAVLGFFAFATVSAVMFAALCAYAAIRFKHASAGATSGLKRSP